MFMSFHEYDFHTARDNRAILHFEQTIRFISHIIIAFTYFRLHCQHIGHEHTAHHHHHQHRISSLVIAHFLFFFLSLRFHLIYALNRMIFILYFYRRNTKHREICTVHTSTDHTKLTKKSKTRNNILCVCEIVKLSHSFETECCCGPLLLPLDYWRCV